MHYWSYGPNRTLCDVLNEIRKLDQTKNYSSLLSLIEEVQVLANRMEAALGDYHDYNAMLREKKKLKEELKSLKDNNDG